MNTIKILAGSMMLLMAATTIICGMWIKTNHIIDPGTLLVKLKKSGYNIFRYSGWGTSRYGGNNHGKQPIDTD